MPRWRAAALRSRRWRCAGLIVAILLFGTEGLQTAVAEGDTRTLSFHHVHTGENITVTFKRNGRYDEAALEKLNWFMRDWRKEEQTRMDPHLFDLLWEAYREVGGKEPIQVICGYRAPGTNAMLRARSNGVAQNSLHTHGDAMDFFIPGVPLEKIREAGLRLQRGGVGFYPTSGSPFVHMDTGRIRHWPRMTHDQLVKVFPDGRTVHVPSDGQPLAGYALALADVEKHGKAPNDLTLRQAEAAGAIDAEDVAEAATIDSGNPTKPGSSFSLASLFGFGGNSKSAPAAKPSSAPVRVATQRIVPMPKNRPAPTEPVQVAMAAITPTPLPRPSIPAEAAPIAQRGQWAASQTPNLPAVMTAPFEVASADAMTTASTSPLAYADVGPAPASSRPAPMGATLAQAARGAERQLASAGPAPLTGVYAPDGLMNAPLSGGRAQGPWLRAAMLTPSVSHYLTATHFGERDMRTLERFMHKPAASLMLSFAGDPAHGLRSDGFSGQAVVFLATTTYRLRTAALR